MFCVRSVCVFFYSSHSSHLYCNSTTQPIKDKVPTHRVGMRIRSSCLYHHPLRRVKVCHALSRPMILGKSITSETAARNQNSRMRPLISQVMITTHIKQSNQRTIIAIEIIRAIQSDNPTHKLDIRTLNKIKPWNMTIDLIRLQCNLRTNDTINNMNNDTNNSTISTSQLNTITVAILTTNSSIAQSLRSITPLMLLLLLLLLQILQHYLSTQMLPPLPLLLLPPLIGLTIQSNECVPERFMLLRSRWHRKVVRRLA